MYDGYFWILTDDDDDKNQNPEYWSPRVMLDICASYLDIDMARSPRLVTIIETDSSMDFHWSEDDAPDELKTHWRFPDWGKHLKEHCVPVEWGDLTLRACKRLYDCGLIAFRQAFGNPKWQYESAQISLSPQDDPDIEFGEGVDEPAF